MPTIEQITLGLVESDAEAPEWLSDLVEAVIALDEAIPLCVIPGCGHPGTHVVMTVCECHDGLNEVVH